ncbi:hypothetical protein ARMGADRAFT_1085777 [Armillaria gallica]|uniref:Uncharacterized protein n=1 Tax=Armillaria gallica TaxID=47427 RepID=A0A2H3DGI6_ARMGA|nr:hypothetical protein ARMGADRAFT_1085777 [Armillaria gallica]
MSAECIPQAGPSQQGNSKPSLLRKAVVTTDDRLFLAFAAVDLAPIPQTGLADPSQQISARFPVDPTLYLERGWWINSIPYQALVPVDTYAACRCRLLRCLNYNRTSIPLETRGERWFLRQDVFRDWRDLETVILRLREVSQSAVSDLRRGHAFFSWPDPARYGYGRGHVDHLKLTGMLMRSRAAYMLILAEIAFNALLQPDFWDEVVSRHFESHVTDLFKDSWVARDGEGFQHKGAKCHSWQGMQRVGAFVDVEVCDFPGAFEKMIAAGIPLWLAWGTVHARAAGRYPMVQYTPSDVEVRQALVKKVAPQAATCPHKRIAMGLRALSETSMFHPTDPEVTPWQCLGGGWATDEVMQSEPVPGTDTLSSNAPGGSWGADESMKPGEVRPVQGPQILYEPVSKTEKHHGQRLGERWQDFFSRREEQNEVLKQAESEQS